MIVSEARLTANRANALKSSGPKTAEGKERSRCNAVKHGMTGAGIAITEAEAAAVEARFSGFQADYRPRTEAGTALVRRAALLSVRLERSAVREAAAIGMNVRAAAADFDEAREAKVEGLFEAMEENPASAVRKLLRMPEGVDRMLEIWGDLRDDLTHEDGSRWSDEHGVLAVHLTGRRLGGIGIARSEALALAVSGDFSLLKPADGAGLAPDGRRDWAREALAGFIDAQVAKLEAHRSTLDLESIEADRDGAAARALFDPSKEATLARKYEAAAGREMHRSLKEMRAIEAEAAGRPDPAPTMGSISPGTAPRPLSPTPAPSPIPPTSRFGVEEGPSYVPITVGRPETLLR